MGGEIMKSNNVVQRLGIWAVIVGAILLIPLLGKAPWTMGDFIFAGVVLFGAATIYEVMTKKMDRAHRIAVGFAVAMVVFLIWGWAVA
jgi:hypothetical protein